MKQHGSHPGHRPQRGAVAILLGLSIFVLFGFMALAIDLGRTYVVRTELQNAADAAALAGAKQLDQTAAGVCCGPDSAVAYAIAMAAQNNYKFSTAVTITIANLSVGSCPDDGCMVAASSIGTNNALAAGKTFLKVDIPSGGLATFFARVPTTADGTGTLSTSTYGRAVAGKYLIDITPLAVCKLDENPEFGYERGVSYKVADANPIGPGTTYWIDPVATTSSACNGNVPDTIPYVCAGKLTFTPTLGGTVYTNTGVSDPQLEALDSRFVKTNRCDPITAPPDTNVKEYAWDGVSGGAPRDWMNPDPTQQSLSFVETGKGKNKVYGPMARASRTFQDYGVLWSASRPVGATVSDWSSLYGGAATSYPETSPYAQSSVPYFSPPPSSNPAKPGRRILHLLIVDCLTAGGICRPATVLGVGKFFMQKRANVPTDKEVYLEFSGLDPIALSNAEIRLYR